LANLVEDPDDPSNQGRLRKVAKGRVLPPNPVLRFVDKEIDIVEGKTANSPTRDRQNDQERADDVAIRLRKTWVDIVRNHALDRSRLDLNAWVAACRNAVAISRVVRPTRPSAALTRRRSRKSEREVAKEAVR